MREPEENEAAHRREACGPGKEGRAMRGFRVMGLVLAPCLLLAALMPAVAGARPSPEPFEIVPGSFHFVPSSLQAGAHADWTTSFDFGHTAKGQSKNDVRNITVRLPAGFIGNNTAVPTCTDSQLNSELPGLHAAACPPGSVIGRISFKLGGNQSYSVPLYNMEVTSPGVVAAIGFHIYQVATVMPITVRPGDEGLTVSSPNIPGLGEVR
jgi:hypothetical protein